MVEGVVVVFFRYKVVGALQICEQPSVYLFLLIGISIGRVRSFSTGFYGERPGQNQRTDHMRINEENDVEGVCYTWTGEDMR